MAQPSQVTKTYFPELDGLRTLAVGLVIFLHVLTITELTAPQIEAHPFWRFGLNGQLGVDLFFVISGFLISSILLEVRERGGSARAFWMRRVVRIFPLHYLYLAVILVATSLPSPLHGFSSTPETVLGWLPYFLYFGNFALMLTPTLPSMGVAILWSLAVEEQFYAIWPFVIRNNDDKTLWKVVGAMLLIAPLLRFAVLWAAPQSDAWYYVTFFHLDPLLVGALLALCWRTPHLRERITPVARWLMLPASAFILFVLQDVSLERAFVSHAWLAASFFLVALSFGVIVWNVLQPGPVLRAIFGNPVAVYIGKISYGMYIWHVLVGYTIYAAVNGQISPTLLLILTLAGTVLLASASWYGFEKPFLRLKKRFPYEPKSGAATDTKAGTA